MKIAYINQPPEQAELTAFIQENRLGSEYSKLTGSKHFKDINLKEPMIVISAYDNEHLAAFGYTLAQGPAPMPDSADIYVLPAYQKRGLASNVYKLLLAEWKYSPVNARL
ncbi:GNAT family N-acetyltransferase [Paenibacillus eucommiae]|uniref:GNAT superfamily N-acetyltransferase n=1 Tax=Paenibacillus eucommiae TaxID=1355755 RepID=A0ABS4J0Z8_9BACL|nr:GNAT family N-acetyltransferase [Paenibacillus eucommiae]MBP1993512.1 GNAT superfamily N-acetyltransferase [Paenibacillus eucommiae]